MMLSTRPDMIQDNTVQVHITPVYITPVYINNTNKQNGAALVIAMLILSLVTVFAASMMIEYNFSVRRVTNQLTSQQAYNYLLGTEAIAHKALMMDLQLDRDDGSTVDHLGEIWAQEVPPFVIEDGAYGGRIYDLQGRFNLNSLRDNTVLPIGQIQPAVPFTIEQGIFIRLLQAMSDDDYAVDEDKAIAITEAVVDWLDSDGDARGFNCGEDDAYYNIDGRQPHRTSNLPFASVSELLLICNMPVKLYLRLLPHVTVWPASGKSSINVNTATTPLLRSLFVAKEDVPKLQMINGRSNFLSPPPLTEDEVKTIVEHQGADGYDQLAQVEVDIDGYELWPNGPIGLYSNYFILESTAIMGDLTQTMSSVISREGGIIVFIARSTGGL